MNRTEVKTMDDLPELPFEQILSYLSLEDRLKSMAVSRSWRKKFDIKVKSLCYSALPSGFIFEKRRLISGAFARNFISSLRFDSFFATFGQSILSNLKHLRICQLRLNSKEIKKEFTRTLNSLGHLTELDLIRFTCCSTSKQPAAFEQKEFELNLPMLKRIRFKNLRGTWKLTLDAPSLQKVQLADCPNLSLVIRHGKSVEKLLIEKSQAAVKNLKNLKYFYTEFYSGIDSTLLSDLNQLKEVHLIVRSFVKQLFEQKERYGRADLKIYLCGLLLNGPDDPAIDSLSGYNNKELFVHLAENRSRLADEIPSYPSLHYSAIERVAPELAIDVLNRFTDLSRIEVDEPVQDIERFLDVLKIFDNITELEFRGDQPRGLFDRLPEHCAVQSLTIENAQNSDFRFLSRLNHLIELDIKCLIGTKLLRKILEELNFLSWLDFRCLRGRIQIDVLSPGRFDICLGVKWTEVHSVDAAIQFITVTHFAF